MADPRSTEFTTRSLWEILFRHKKKIVVCPLLAIALGAAVIAFCPRTYRSEAQLFLRIGRESVGIDPTATAGQTVPLQQFDRKDEIKSAIQVLKSRATIAKTVDQLGPEVVLEQAGESAPPSSPLVQKLKAPLQKLVALYKSIDPISQREEAIIAMERSLHVEAEREATLIVVKYDADSPQHAQTICNALIEVYQQEHMRIHRNRGSRPFFTEQQERLRAELDDSLGAVRTAKNEMGLASVDARRATLESQFSAIELERLTTRQQLAAATARIAELETQLTKIPAQLVDSQKSVPNAGADLLRDQLYALEVKSMDLRARYSDTHPLVQAVTQQLDDARKVVAQQADQRVETTNNINPIHRQLSLELKQEQGVLAGLKARSEELARQKETTLADLRSINDAELKLDQLSRKADLARDKFAQYSRNIEEAFIDSALESENISNVSVVQPATLAERPVSPSKAVVALATLVLATAGTGALVLASEKLNGRLHSEDDVENALGVPVLGAIPGDRAHRRIFATRVNGRPQAAPQAPSRV